MDLIIDPEMVNTIMLGLVYVAAFMWFILGMAIIKIISCVVGLTTTTYDYKNELELRASTFTCGARTYVCSCSKDSEALGSALVNAWCDDYVARYIARLDSSLKPEKLYEDYTRSFICKIQAMNIFSLHTAETTKYYLQLIASHPADHDEFYQSMMRMYAKLPQEYVEAYEGRYLRTLVKAGEDEEAVLRKMREIAGWWVISYFQDRTVHMVVGQWTEQVSKLSPSNVPEIFNANEKRPAGPSSDDGLSQLITSLTSGALKR
jgi:hypothetical protein